MECFLEYIIPKEISVEVSDEKHNEQSKQYNMKTSTLINEIIENIEKIVRNIRKLYISIKKSFKKEKM